MKAALFVSWCFVVIGGAHGRTKECCCGYGTLCLDFGKGPINIPCTSLDVQCEQISKPFYERGTDCNTLKNACTTVSPAVKPCVRGKCVPTFGSYFCECPPGWYGKRCDISDPALGADGATNPLYIYYQVQTGLKGKRTRFHLIYDTGPQTGIMQLAETGIKVHIEVDDGRDYHPMRRTEFKQQNVKEICIREAEAVPDLNDIRVCGLLPEGDQWVFSFDPEFHTHVRSETEVMFASQKVGTVGNVRIRITYLRDGNELYSLYDEVFPLFSYAISKVLNDCKKIVSFDGCVLDKSSPSIYYLRGYPISIKSIIESQNCTGTRHIGTKWFLQRGPGFQGKYDPVPKELKFGDSRSITFPPRFFTNGDHMIEVRLSVKGDPPHYGGPTVYTIYGRCFLRVVLGPLLVQAKGGNEVASACGHKLEINFISNNPGMLVSEMTFTVRCYQPNLSPFLDEDPECKERKVEVPILRKFNTPCNTVYEFNVTVEHFITETIQMNLSVIVHFVRDYVKMGVTCLFNCQPIDTQYRTVLVASTDPYVPASIGWKVVVDDTPIDPANFGADLPAFLPLSTTRILRADGTFLHDPAQSLTEVRFSASVLESTNLVSTTETVTHNLFHEVSKFVGTYSFDPTDNIPKISYNPRDPGDLHFVYGPMEFQLIQIQQSMKDSLYLGTSNYYDALTTRPDFGIVMLCVRDPIMMRSCTAPMTLVNLTLPRKVTSKEIEQLYEEGNDRELLIKSALGIHSQIRLIPAKDQQVMVWSANHLRRKVLVMNILQNVLKTRKLQEMDIQAIMFILTMAFFSTEGNHVESLYPFTDRFDLSEFIKITTKEYRDWMEVRILSLYSLLKTTEWALEYGIQANGEVKFIEFQYGDLLEVVCSYVISVIFSGIVKCWNMAHMQSIFVKRIAKKLSREGQHNEILDTEILVIYLENEKLLEIILQTFVKSLYSYARVFYGIRNIGHLHTKFWTVKTTYQGILAAFNKNNTGETLTGYCDYIFGPVLAREKWLQDVVLKLPGLEKVAVLTGRELFMAVGIINNRFEDATSSPTLILFMSGKDNQPYQQLPGGEEFEVSFPVLINGRRSKWSSPVLYEDNLLRPSNDTDKYKYYSVYKVMLPIEFEVWNLEIYTKQRTEIKAKVKFKLLPDYEEVEKKAPLRSEFVPSLSHFISEREVKPYTSAKTIPRYFYIGLLLTNKTAPDTPILIKVRNTVDICWLKDLDQKESEIICKGKQLQEPIIYCICNKFGIISARPASIRISKILMAEIQLFYIKSISSVQLSLPVIVGLIVIAAISIASLWDRYRRKQAVSTRVTPPVCASSTASLSCYPTPTSFVQSKTTNNATCMLWEVLIPMYDSHPRDSYPFIIGVFTSPNLLAGTRSTVAIKLEGRSSSSRVHLLKSKSRRTLKSASDDWFVMTTNQPLGKIEHVLLWHDYHCLSNWYCDHILIYDVKQDTWYMASVKRWFRIHQTVEESRLAQIKTFKYGNLESGIRGTPTQLEQYIPETRNSHYFFSMFTLHHRSMYSFENRTIAFLIKMLATFFGSLFIQTQHLFHDDVGVDISEPTLDDIHVDADTIGITVVIDLFSYAFTIPYMLLVSTTFMSGLIQKKTTNPVNMDVIRKEQTTVGADKKDGKKVKNKPLIETQVHRSVLFQLDSTDRSVPELSVSRREENLQAKGRKQWTATHFQHSRLQKLLTLLFGPCQFRCIDVSPQVLEVKMMRRILYSRLLAVILLSGLFGFFLYVEEFTNYGAKYYVTLFYVPLVILFDCILINPIIIFLRTFVMFRLLQTSNREYQLLSEHAKVNMPTPLGYLEYFHTATKKAYKPMLSTEIEVFVVFIPKLLFGNKVILVACYWSTSYRLRVMKKSNIYHAVRICFTYLYIFICIVIVTYLQVSRHDKGYFLTVRAITAAAEQQSMTTGLKADIWHGINMRDVVHPINVEEFIQTTFGELQYAWPNGQPMTPSGKRAHNTRWFLDRESQTIGPARILIMYLSASKQMKIPKYFTEYYKHSYGFLSESEVETSKIVLADKDLNYTNINQFYLLEGKSRLNYELKGNVAIIPTADWREYYISLTTIVKDLNDRADLMPRVLIMSYNIVATNTLRLTSVDLVVEYLPSGECSARIHISSTKIKHKHALGFDVLRSLLMIMALTHIGVAVVDISTMGFMNYITHWYGIVKMVLAATGIILSITTIMNYVQEYKIFDRLFNAPSDKYFDLHGVLNGELLDSCVLATFLLLMCVDVAVAIRDAMGLQIISVVSTKGLQMSLIVLLLFIIYSSAAAVSSNVLATSYDFMVAFFGKCFFPLSGYHDENQFFLVVALTMLCIMKKFSLAMFVYHVEAFDGNYVSLYHPGRSAAILNKLKPLRDTKEVKMHYLKKHSTYVTEQSPNQKVKSKRSLKKGSDELRSISTKLSSSKRPTTNTLSSKTSVALPDTKRKVETRRYKLNDKFFNWF